VAPYFVNHVLKYLVAKYGEEKVYRGGLKVYTTLDLEAQNAAEEIITKIVSREGRTFRFSQAALVALDPRTGYIKTMVGGIDYEESKFNRVIQARRQPGSSFKPFIYTAAMEAGLSPGTLVLDTASTWETTISRWTPRGRWRPYNFDRKFHGPVTIRYAIEFSLNIPAIKVLDKVSPAKAIDVARRMGIKSPLEQSLALALGVSDVSLLEMTSAFGVFANAGIRVEPACIIKVVDRQGNILEQNQIQGKKVLNPNIAAVMVDMLKGVLTRGTGFKGRLEREAAAKTGTTNNYKDAWFIGFVPQLVCGVWVGNDNNTPMRGVAEVSVCPRIWQAFMKAALQDLPPQSFTRPLGLVSVQICLDSEQLATDKCPKNRIKTKEYWKAKVPTSPCPIHTETEDPELIELNKTINEPPEGYLIR
jgi:penicillin-binding protein 1A